MRNAPRPITFTCSHCHKDVTENRKAGPTPKYCRPCNVEVRHAAAINNNKQQREYERERLAKKKATS